jgi:hypothetical protein
MKTSEFGNEMGIMSMLVSELTAEHADHTGVRCNGGRDDCCWRCAVMLAMIPAVKEMNDSWCNVALPIKLPAWAEAESVRRDRRGGHRAPQD